MKRKQIVLFHPIGFEYPEGKKGLESLAGVPLSVLAAGSLLKLNGYTVKVVSGAEKDYFNKIMGLIKEGPLCVGISSMTGYQITQGIKVAKAVRDHNKAIPIVWGGFHPSILPEQTVKSPYADIAVRGYGERTLLELVEVLENGGSLEGVKGITYRKNTDIISNPERPIEDINSFPPIPYDLVDVPRFLTNELGGKTIAYVSSRGCPNNCSFCADKIVYKRRWNALRAETVLNDLSMLKERYGIDSVRFMDSNFFVDEKRVVAICEGMIERNLQLKWGRVNGSAEILIRYSEETWRLMERSGCFSIAVGAESGYQEALNRINKKAMVEDVEKLAGLSKKYNITMLYALMLGIPIDLSDSNKQREHFLKELSGTLGLIGRVMKDRRKFDRAIIFRFTLYPGGNLYEECKKYGWSEPASLDEWSENNLFKAKMPWLTTEESNIIDSVADLILKAYPAVAQG